MGVPKDRTHGLVQKRMCSSWQFWGNLHIGKFLKTYQEKSDYVVVQFIIEYVFNMQLVSDYVQNI